MDILKKHYEEVILAIAILALILGLFVNSHIVSEAHNCQNMDEPVVKQARGLKSKGQPIDDFDAKAYVSREAWINRIKEGKQADVVTISDDIQNDITKKWDRRYFNVLTRHSAKPLEVADARYKLTEKTRALEEVKKSIQEKERAIAQRSERKIANDTYLTELKSQLAGYKSMQQSLAIEVTELTERLNYLERFISIQGSLIDPQEIIVCVNPRCSALILSDMDKCPFCQMDQSPVNPDQAVSGDTDGDGIPDYFEKKHMRDHTMAAVQLNQNALNNNNTTGMTERQTTTDKVLNYQNKADAIQDFDGDGFTNLEEYRWKTDLDDRESYPDPAVYVRIDEDFAYDRLPFQFLEIKRKPNDQKARWRAVFAPYKGEKLDTSDVALENKGIGKVLTAPDGKQYEVVDMGDERVANNQTGPERQFVLLKDYVKVRKNARNEQPAATTEVRQYKMYAKEDYHFVEKPYAPLIFLATRNVNALSSIYRARYRVNDTILPTRFRLAQGELLVLRVPFRKKEAVAEDNAAEPVKKRSRLKDPERRNDDMMGGTGAMDGGMETPSAAAEYEFREFYYTLANFDAKAKTLELIPAEKPAEPAPEAAAPAAKAPAAAATAPAAKAPAATAAPAEPIRGNRSKEAVKIGVFDEDESYEMNGKTYPLLYEGEDFVTNDMTGGGMM